MVLTIVDLVLNNGVNQENSYLEISFGDDANSMSNYIRTSLDEKNHQMEPIDAKRIEIKYMNYGAKGNKLKLNYEIGIKTIFFGFVSVSFISSNISLHILHVL